MTAKTDTGTPGTIVDPVALAEAYRLWPDRHDANHGRTRYGFMLGHSFASELAHKVPKGYGQPPAKDSSWADAIDASTGLALEPAGDYDPEARIKELEDALRPFANKWDKRWVDISDAVIMCPAVTAGQLWRAWVAIYSNGYADLNVAE